MQNKQKKETEFAKNTQKEKIWEFSKERRIWHIAGKKKKNKQEVSNMGYRLEITDNALCIQGLYGSYEASDNGNGFLVSVILDTCTNELDAEGEEYLVESGQEWAIVVDGLTELNAFIKKCENERMWNYMCGPTFRMKMDTERGILYLKGQTKNFFIGEDGGRLYVDTTQGAGQHREMATLLEAARTMAREDKWWMRPADESLDLMRNMRCAACVTDGGNLRLEYRNKSALIGQKDDGSYWMNVVNGQEKHILYKESWKDVLAAML